MSAGLPARQAGRRGKGLSVSPHTAETRLILRKGDQQNPDGASLDKRHDANASRAMNDGRPVRPCNPFTCA